MAQKIASLIIALGVGGLWSADVSVAGTYDNLTVTDIEITCIGQEWHTHILKKLALHVGDPFSREAIRESIRTLYALKEFSQVTVEAEKVEGGVRLSFCTAQVNRVSKIVITGNRAISSEVIRSVIDLEIGNPITTNEMEDMKRDLLALYRDRGYHQTRLSMRTEEDPGLQKVTLHIDIQEGVPSTIATLGFRGATVFTERELIKISKHRPSMRFTLDNLKEIMVRVKRAYDKKGYFNLTFQDRDVKFYYDTGKADVVVTLEEGKPTIVLMEGNLHVPAKTLKQLFPLSEFRQRDETILDEYVAELTTYYHAKGFPFVQITYQQSIEDDHPTLTFAIDEGPQVYVENMSFEGNHAFQGKELRKLMFTGTKGLFSKGLYQEKIFNDDVTAIKAFYQQHGYLTADVVSVSREFSKDRRRVSLHLVIEEGEQTRVRHIYIHGEEDDDTLTEIRKRLLFQEDAPLDMNQVTKSVNVMKEIYANQGYIMATVDITPKFCGDGRQVDVTLDIHRGRQFFIGKITMQGIVRTRKRFISRELQIQEGDVYRREAIKETVRRLLQLGFYDSVSFRRLDPKNTDRYQPMLLEVKETSAIDVKTGIGYSTVDRFKGFIEYSNRNVLNYGGRVSARAEMSLKRPKLTLQYIQPYFFTRDTDLVVTIFDDIQKDNASYDVERRGGRVGLRYELHKTVSMSANYFIESDDPSEVKEDVILSDLDTDVLTIAGLSVQAAWDTRDNLLLPTQGGHAQLGTRMALDLLGSDAAFLETTARMSWFQRLYKQLILATSAKVQLIESIRDSTSIPIYYRYFLGGDISQNNPVRGFAKHEIGPTSPGNNKIGGDRMAVLNAELRFPVYGVIGGVVFYDTGLNWLKAEGYQDKYRRQAVGAGLRVVTPVGPLRFDYGWKLDRRPGESAGEYYLTIGSAF